MERIELSRCGGGGHRGSLGGRDSVRLRHGNGSAVTLGEIHLLVNSARRILWLLVVLLRRHDRGCLMTRMCLLHRCLGVVGRGHGPDGSTRVRGPSLIRAGNV